MIKLNYLLSIPCCLLLFFVLSSFSVYDLTCELDKAPLGVETSNPRFSWKHFSEERNFVQSAYQIEVADDASKIDMANMWDSGKVISRQSVLVPYSGNKLNAMITYYWRVRTWDKNGKVSNWSEIYSFSMGVLSESDWQNAKWIALQKDNKAFEFLPPVNDNGEAQKRFGGQQFGNYKLPQFRRTFSLKKSLVKAIAYVSGVGQFDFFINGKKVGNHFLDPGWTKFDKEVLYVPFNVTENLKDGENVLGVMLGNGFYNIPNDRYYKLITSYGAPKLKMMLRLEYSDGTTAYIVTDKSWKATDSPITFSSIYGGEDYDATKELAGWKDVNYDDSKWQSVVITDYNPKMQSEKNNPITIHSVLQPVRVFKNTKGWVYDFGQNLSGIVRLTVKSADSKNILLRPAELLNPDSTVNQSATGQPYYFLYKTKGGKEETWQPQFTYYGFRYVQVEGAVPVGKENTCNQPEIIALASLHTCNSAPEAGSFYCSKPLFNRIYTLIDWAMRSNMSSVLTDCPHREKLGWLEQDHLMMYSLLYRYNMSRLYEKLENDMNTSQRADGCIPTIAPEYVRFANGFEDTPEWGSAFIISAWYAYKFYGDKSNFENFYPSMKRYIDYLSSKANDHIIAYGLGDWFDIGPKDPGYSQLTSNGVTATAVYYYDVTIMQKIATVLGNASDASEYAALAVKIKQSFNNHYFDQQTKKIDRNSQTANAMPLFVGLVDKEYAGNILHNLVEDIQGRNNALTAGDVGYRYVLQILQKYGRSDVIYDMNCKYDVPGYGWQLAHGATALTESWQAYGFVSNNHFMLGHLMEWLFSGLGGIKQSDESVAFSEVLINPSVVGDVTTVTTSYESSYGTILCKWELKGADYILDVTIPANSNAKIVLPTKDITNVTDFGEPVSQKKDINVDQFDSKLRLTVGSGTYRFVVKDYSSDAAY
ncbi:MAG: family 78 glycoside hydrolase catalytic domain [Phocaeicola sp.]|uniref:family 78 glycoside hydrolase catalytic domain n=1 Tax=Phocaeicola sp. TaxID=2773926 RepID=UPI003F9F0368